MTDPASPRRPRRPRSSPNVDRAPALDPTGKRLDRVEDLPELSDEDLEKRIGAQPATRVRPVRARPERARYVGATRRRVLWRDSATILVGVVLALLAARFLLPGGPAASPTPGESTSVVVVTPTAALESSIAITPIPTIGGVVASGLHIDATPTPPPLITLGPITPPPATPRPTTTPAASHTPKPTVKPTATPLPPVAAFACVQGAGFTEVFTNQSTGNVSSYLWDFGDTTTSTAASPSHDYSAVGDYTVTLTVTGPGGTNSDSHTCSVT